MLGVGHIDSLLELTLELAASSLKPICTWLVLLYLVPHTWEDGAGKGASDFSAASKHVLAELKALHLADADATCPSDKPLARATEAASRQAVPRHDLPVDYLQLDIPLSLKDTDGSSATRPTSALGMLMSGHEMPPAATKPSVLPLPGYEAPLPLCDDPEREQRASAAHLLALQQNMSAVGSAGALRLLHADSGDLDKRQVAQTQTVAELVHSESGNQKMPKPKTNGWILFCKACQQTAKTVPGEAADARRIRVLEEARRQWKVPRSLSCRFHFKRVWV